MRKGPKNGRKERSKKKKEETGPSFPRVFDSVRAGNTDTEKTCRHSASPEQRLSIRPSPRLKTCKHFCSAEGQEAVGRANRCDTTERSDRPPRSLGEVTPPAYCCACIHAAQDSNTSSSAAVATRLEIFNIFDFVAWAERPYTS